ncbi:phosphoglycerate mutase [Skermanella aerolata]|uniref:Phosphoglycerate mutase n=1 Tax=Skermanella aerolata TaxID=393310 RepID=A0A512DR03_9PROT|nr:histidine phosphatase family protein [Skermanella aerolata]KJB92787.1 alpha-ribazole-5'-phosphate phosphatase [Skermanella aerolata KACC 11604]GEO38620.1 phosphoglycerate mutase [Skermanella aerolata]
MEPVTRWWLVRHAPAINPDGLIYGQGEIAVDCSDRTALDALASLLPADPVRMVTPLARTGTTAEALWGGPWSDRDCVVEPALLEQSFGDWQGLSHDALSALGDAQVAAFWQAPATATPPGGESFADVVARVAPALERRSAEFRGRDIAAVCHGGSIRAALAVALGLSPAQALAFQIDPLSLTRIDHIPVPNEPAVWRVVTVNRS